MPTPRLISLTEAVELFQAASGREWPSLKTVSRWCDSGVLTAVRVRRGRRFDRMVLEESAREVAHAIQLGVIAPAGNWKPKKGTVK